MATWPCQRGQGRLVEGLGDQAHVLVDEDLAAVADRDPGRLLAAVLQRVEPEVGQLGDVLARGPDPEDSAGVLRPLLLRVQVVGQPAVTGARLTRHAHECKGSPGPSRTSRAAAGRPARGRRGAAGATDAGQSRGDRPGQGRGQRLGLALPDREQHQPLGAQDRGQPLREHPSRHLVGEVEEPRVVGARALGQLHDPRHGVQRGAGLVEADVAVGADAEHLDADAGRAHLLLVAGRLGLEVVGAPVGTVDVVGPQVGTPHQLAPDDAPVGLGVVGRQTDVLVEQVGLAAGEREPAGRDATAQLGVGAQRGRPRGHAERGGARADGRPDQVGRRTGHRVGVGQHPQHARSAFLRPRLSGSGGPAGPPPPRRRCP